MEEISNAMEMLDLMVRPAFCVRDGVIIYANYPAQQQMLCEGTKLSDILITGAEEYAEFRSGCLHLTIQAAGQSCGTSVTRMDGFDVFVLEQEDDNRELQAMALAAKELRTPLSSVMLVADQLFPLADSDDDPAIQQRIARLNRGLFQILRVVSNMSDAVQYSTAALSQQEIRDIPKLLEEIFSTAAEQLRHTQISLNFTNLPNSVYSYTDAIKLERAVNNLLSNAAKFTPKGGSIQAKLYRRNTKLYLSIQDSGTGVAPHLRQNIYACYQRMPGMEDSRFGIGLGMVLVRSIAAQHGGTVLVEYPEEGGTRVTMTLSIRQGKENTLSSPIFLPDYLAGWNHSLVELSDVLPHTLYEKE